MRTVPHPRSTSHQREHMSLHRRIARLLLSVALALATAAPGAAQQTESRIVGKITDASGAVLPGVSVTVTLRQTGAVRTVVTDSDGRYVVTNLAPGTYEVKGELDGFAPKSGELAVGAGDIKPLDLSLAVANVAEAVTVMADATVIDTTSAKLGVNVSPEELKSLPVNGRNFANLMTLATGATTDGNGGWASVRFNGKSNQQNYLNYDGVDGSYVWDASPGYLNATGSQFRLQTSMESIAEFRVNSGLAPAESGLGAGGNITVISKSGSNRFNGSLFNYFRNDALDSASKYDDKKQDLEFNQFGGSLGGPIATNRTFFFGSYEGLKQTIGLSLHRGGAERRSHSPHPGRRAGRQRAGTEPGADAGGRATARRLPPGHGGDRQPAARARDAQHPGRADRARAFGPRRSPLHQQPVALRPRALQRRRRRHARSHGDAAARARHAAAAQRRRQPSVALRDARDQRAENRLQPAALRRHRLRYARLRSDAGVALGHGDLAVDRRARHHRRGAQRPARPRDQQRLDQRTVLRPALARHQRRDHDFARRAHVQGRRRVPQHRVAVPVPRQQRDHLRRHQRVHRQSPDAGGGLARIAGLHAAAVLPASASRRTPGASAAG